MSSAIGYSSELYFIEPQDIINLADATVTPNTSIKKSNEIMVFLGNKELGTNDTLICGREIALQAINSQISHVPVRFAFASNIAKWNIPAIFFKKLRCRFKFSSPTIYHTTLTHLRNLHIERGFRNADNAYVISKKWNISPEERILKYNQLRASLKEKGFDDKHPISIMLCRRCGIKDSVDDGHHRIGICLENNIERIAIHFNAAGRFPQYIQKWGLKLINLFPKMPD